MRKSSVLLCTFFACALTGCSEDPNEAYLAATISILKETTTNVEEVTKLLTDAVAQAKNDTQAKNDKTWLAILPIEKATEKAGELKSKALRLQNIKARTEGIKDTLTPDQRSEYAEKHKGALQSSLEGLDSAEKKLEDALREAQAEADDTGKNALEKLREKLKEGQNEFEVMTKRQS